LNREDREEGKSHGKITKKNKQVFVLLPLTFRRLRVLRGYETA